MLSHFFGENKVKKKVSNKLQQNEAINNHPTNQGSYVKTLICHKIVKDTWFALA